MAAFHDRARAADRRLGQEVKPEAWIESHRAHLNTVGNRAFDCHPWGTRARPTWLIRCYCAQHIVVPNQTEAERLCELGERKDDAGLFQGD